MTNGIEPLRWRTALAFCTGFLARLPGPLGVRLVEPRELALTQVEHAAIAGRCFHQYERQADRLHFEGAPSHEAVQRMRTSSSRGNSLSYQKYDGTSAITYSGVTKSPARISSGASALASVASAAVVDVRSVFREDAM